MSTLSHRITTSIARRNTLQKDQRIYDDSEHSQDCTYCWKDSHPLRPRNTSKVRTPLGPSKGSGIFCQYLIIIRDGLWKQRRRNAHVCDRENICNRLSRDQFWFCSRAHRATYHSDQYQLQKSSKKSARGGNTRSGWSHLESWHRLVQTIEELD